MYYTPKTITLMCHFG